MQLEAREPVRLMEWKAARRRPYGKSTAAIRWPIAVLLLMAATVFVLQVTKDPMPAAAVAPTNAEL